MACPRLVRNVALAGIALGAIVAVAVTLDSDHDRGVFAGLPPGPTPTPKPNGLGSLSGVYDALVHDGTKTTSSYHCILRLDHDSVSNQAKAAAQCYADTPGLSPVSPLVDTADGAPGPPPPPPYATARPMKLFGAYDPGTDLLTLTGCFKDVAGTVGPNVIMVMTVPAAKASVPSLQGTVLIHENQSIAQCGAGSPGAPPPSPRALNLTRAPAARDFDGDGCTDGQELDKLSPASLCGDDPHNPHDSDADFGGPFAAVAPLVFADWNTAQNVLLPGVYLDCLGNAEHNLVTNTVQARAQCYVDSPVLAEINGSAVPARDIGLPGAPPPPPFTTRSPVAFAGSFNPATKRVTMIGCLANIGGATGPNVILEMQIGVTTGQGTAAIHFNHANADCDAAPPTLQGIPDFTSLLLLAEQDLGLDSDGDGCGDAQELAIAAPALACGDDPFNPFDTDADATGVSHILITLNRADWNTLAGRAIPGSYFHCAADTIHNLGANDLTTRVYCYTDDPDVTVNCEDAQGSPALPNGTCIAGNTCPPANASRCGDGLPDSPPPRLDPVAASPNGSTFGDVDSAPTVLAGTYSPATGLLALSGCFLGVENAAQGPSMYLLAMFNIRTGIGAATIYPQQLPVDCAAGAPQGAGLAAGVGWAEQGLDFDTDQDGCTDARELGSVPSLGGLRDPFNYWDFRSVPTGSAFVRDGVIDIGDILAGVLRFGASGDPLGNPVPAKPLASIPPPPAYHTAYDQGGGLTGSAGAWNRKGPDGILDIGDILATVLQFGHNCA